MDLRSTRPGIAEMIEWLYELQHFGIKLGLDNIRALLELLDRPDKNYRSVLVGGTNGKGSVVAMLHALLEAHGVGTGMFTSPHLIRPNERIRCRADDISDTELAERLERMRERIGQGLEQGRLAGHPSFFEVVAATALETFRDHDLGAAVLEVGLGGRLDATNAVDADVSVIVSVDLDHTKALGPTLEQIAVEKAGIIKPGRPLICGTRQRSALDVIEATCAERGATRIDARKAVRHTAQEPDGRLTFESDERHYTGVRLSLAGRHQIDNARIALAAFEVVASDLDIDPDAEAVRSALADVRWPGRLQWHRSSRFTTELLFDGAHNPAGAQSLVDYLASAGRPEPVALIGALRGKLLPDMLRPLAPCVKRVIVTKPGVQRAAEPEEVAKEARCAGMRQVEIVADPAQALERAVRLAGDETYVLVTGSLYLVGEILGGLERREAPGPVSM